jgi:hypothetical protein
MKKKCRMIMGSFDGKMKLVESKCRRKENINMDV